MLRMIFVVLIIAAGALMSTVSAFHGLLFYLWNAYFRPESWVYGGFILSLRLSLIIGIYVVIRTALSGHRLRFPLGAVFVWLFLAQCLVGTLGSEHPTDSWAYFEVFVRVIVITYLIIVLVDDSSKFRWTLLVIALSLGFETAKQGWAGLFLAPGAKNQNPSPFLGDNNGVALGTMMLLPILGALVQTARPRWERFMHRFVAIGVFMRGITTYSRGGFLGAGALAAIYVWRAEKKVRAVVPIVVLAGLVWTVMPRAYWDRVDTIDVSEEERDSSAAGRLHFWRVGVDMARAKPWTGVGLNGYTRSFDSYNTDRLYFGEERAAHSIWFGTMGDLGFPGFGLFVGNLIVALWSCWRVVQMTKSRPELRPLRMYANALISSILVFSVVGSFLSSQYNEMIWHIVGLSSALYLICRKEMAVPATVPHG